MTVWNYNELADRCDAACRRIRASGRWWVASAVAIKWCNWDREVERKEWLELERMEAAEEMERLASERLEAASEPRVPLLGVIAANQKGKKPIN